ncbi:hypothetical protein TIFTF001_038166 [Ficus carica]|uniref:RNase H type-1 domain-containing protein n=1 Tax=Ficus carica TaxID=3494 RepID=A0AA88EA39_FICCA|nr:hypothetical protein TIFTF001_038166 [Ficus carica]
MAFLEIKLLVHQANYLFTKASACLPHLAYLIKEIACSPKYNFHTVDYTAVPSQSNLKSTCLRFSLSLRKSEVHHNFGLLHVPYSSSLKLNVDASAVPGLDFVDFVMGAMAKKVHGIYSPLLAECLAIRDGLQFAADSGLHVHAADSAHGGGSCSAIPCLVNGAAHALARHALALNFKWFWLEEIPYCISSIVVNGVCS